MSEYKSSTTCPHQVLHAHVQKGRREQYGTRIWSAALQRINFLLWWRNWGIYVVWLFANQSLPEGSSIGLIFKKGAQVTAGWQGLGPEVQGAQYHKKRRRADPVMLARVSCSQVSGCQASLMLSQAISLARQGKDLHGIPTTVHKAPELKGRSLCPGQSFLLLSPSFSVFTAV